MKLYLKIFLAFVLTVTGCVPAFGDAVIFSGSDVKTLKANIDLFGNSKILSGSVDPTSVATSAPVGSIYLNTSTGLTYRKLDAGSSTNWTVLGSGSSSGKNYITNGQAEAGTTGWATYADAAGVAPVNGTGGSPTTTWTRSTSTPLAGIGSFILTKDAANRQGEGASYDFALDLVDRAKVLKVDLSYLVNSGTFVAGTTGSSATASDVTVWLYDVTNSTLIQPSSISLYSNSTTLADRYSGYFQTSATGASYRLIVHVGSTSSSAYTLKIDDVSVAPSTYVYGTPITDWQSYSLTIGATTTPPTLGTITTNAAKWRRVGDSMEINYQFYQSSPIGSGANGSGVYLFPIPSGYTIDSTKVGIASDINTASTVGISTGYSVATSSVEGSVYPYNSTNLVIALGNATTAPTNVNSAFMGLGSVEITYMFRASVPITGWSSSVQMSDSADSRLVAFRASGTPTGTPGSGSYAKATFPTVESDTHGGYSSGTYTISTSGFYDISASLVLAGSTYAANDFTSVQIKVNGSAVASNTQRNAPGTGNGTHTSPITIKGVKCNAGDTIEIHSRTNYGTPVYAGAVIDGTENFFSIVKTQGPSAIAATESVNARYTTSAGQAIADSTSTIIDFGTAVYSSHGSVTTGAAWKFTAPTSGTYSISARVLFDSYAWTAGKKANLAIYKNGSYYTNLDRNPVTASVTFLLGLSGGHASVKLLAGDYIDIRIDHDRGSSSNLFNDALFNWIDINRVGNY